MFEIFCDSQSSGGRCFSFKLLLNYFYIKLRQRDAVPFDALNPFVLLSKERSLVYWKEKTHWHVLSAATGGQNLYYSNTDK